MRVAPIDHHWWHDQLLSNYDPRLLGHTQVDSFNVTSVQVFTVSNFLIPVSIIFYGTRYQQAL